MSAELALDLGRIRDRGLRAIGEKVVSRLPATFHPGAGSGAVLPFQVERRKLKFFDRETGRRREPVPIP